MQRKSAMEFETQYFLEPEAQAQQMIRISRKPPIQRNDFET